MSTRVDIRPAAKVVQQEGISAQVIESDPLEFRDLKNSEANQIWHEHTQEAFEIAAILYQELYAGGSIYQLLET